MALTHDGPHHALRAKPEGTHADPAHHVCAVAIATGIALMVAAVPAAMWLVNQAFALGR